MDGLLKHANVPLWLKVPGATVPITGPAPPYERLPGMTEWAPREMVEDVAKGIRGGQDVEDIANEQSHKGLLGDAAISGLTGTFGGVLGSRLISGEKAWEPFKGPEGLLTKGLHGGSWRGLKNLPLSMKLLPLAGAGLGVGLAAKRWADEAPHRQHQTYDVARGLLAERVLQRDALGQAMGREAPTLQGLPFSSANELPPLVVSRGE
jgi:hypothetical protein